MEKLAIFDVDFTITNKETLLEFFKFMLKKDKKNIKYLLRVIISGILSLTNLLYTLSILIPLLLLIFRTNGFLIF